MSRCGVRTSMTSSPRSLHPGTRSTPGSRATESTALTERAIAEQLVIVGGGPAGLQTARSYRTAGGRGAVTLVCEESQLPYERPPLTKSLLRDQCDVDDLPLEAPGWFREHDVEARVGV